MMDTKQLFLLEKPPLFRMEYLSNESCRKNGKSKIEKILMISAQIFLKSK